MRPVLRCGILQTRNQCLAVLCPGFCGEYISEKKNTAYGTIRHIIIWIMVCFMSILIFRRSYTNYTFHLNQDRMQNQDTYIHLGATRGIKELLPSLQSAYFHYASVTFSSDATWPRQASKLAFLRQFALILICNQGLEIGEFKKWSSLGVGISFPTTVEGGRPNVVEEAGGRLHRGWKPNTHTQWRPLC